MTIAATTATAAIDIAAFPFVGAFIVYLAPRMNEDGNDHGNEWVVENWEKAVEWLKARWWGKLWGRKVKGR